jgi:outer membrane protein assembly factor BamB
MSTLIRCVAPLGAVLVLSTAVAQDWPNWRGPNHDGSTEATGLPTSFGKTDNVRWSVDLPGQGESTPIVVGEHVFLTSVDTEREQLVVFCIDRKDGKVRWRKDAGSGYRAGDSGSPVRASRATFAAPSPATDGERVFCFFGNGDLVAYDFAGQELWRRNIQKEFGDFAFNWTFSSSPTFFDGKLYLPVLQRDQPVGRRGGGRRGRGRGGEARAEGAPTEAAVRQEPIESFILAMDPKTGKTMFRHVRPAPARMESLEAYTTLIPYVGPDGRRELLLAGGDVLTGHDPATGKELWRWGTWNEGHRRQDWRLVPSVTVAGSVALVSAPKRAPVYAIALGKSGELDDEAAIVWQSEGRPNPVTSDVPTPAYYRGHAFVLSDMEPSLSKVDPKDGKVVWNTPLSKDWLWRASPTAADGRIWCMNHHGDVVVVDAESGKVVHRAAMGEEDDDFTCSTIVVAHGCVYVRTNAKLFCIAAND